MAKIIKSVLAEGVYVIEIPEADLCLLCGCPPEAIKLLMRAGLVKAVSENGTNYETGPNAILLSDTVIQNGQLSNAIEFAIFHMFFRQGFAIPSANNFGKKPILIGSAEQIDAQSATTFYGTAGLVNTEELISTGISKELAREIIQLKSIFFPQGFPSLEDTKNYVDTYAIADSPIVMGFGVSIERLAFNQFKLSYLDECVTINLNIPETYQYPTSYALNYVEVKRCHFSIVHSGDGDGWDPTRSSMSSIIVYKGEIYLIDLPPYLDRVLDAFGISINEIKGVFHTHVHDDHFGGVVSLLAIMDRPIKYYVAPMVLETMVRKFTSCLGVDRAFFHDNFQVHHLDFEQWNDIDGLMIKPVYSPHPVETTIFYFKVRKDQKTYTYGHLADVISLEKLKSMVNSNENEGISKTFYDKVKKDYLIPVNVKKIDVDGGLIHGDAEDFRHDKSGRLGLSHTEHELTPSQREIGEASPFGSADVLIEGEEVHYLKALAAKYLMAYFPDITQQQVSVFAQKDIVYFGPNVLISSQPGFDKHAYLILTGKVEEQCVGNEKNIHLEPGDIINEYALLAKQPSGNTYRSISFVILLELPMETFQALVDKCKLRNNVRQFYEDWQFWRNTTLFSNVRTRYLKRNIIDIAIHHHYAAGKKLSNLNAQSIYVIFQGSVKRCFKRKTYETLNIGDFFNEEVAFFQQEQKFDFIAADKLEVYELPIDMFKSIPAVNLKIIEVYNKRLFHHF